MVQQAGPHCKGYIVRGKNSEYVVVCFGPPVSELQVELGGICHCRLGDSSWQLIIGSIYRDMGCLILRKGFYRHAGNMSEDRTQALGGWVIPR